MQLIDGKATAQVIKLEIAAKVKSIISEGGKVPHLAAVLVGTDGGSETYISSKIKSCEEVGFKSTLIRFSENVTEKELLDCIENLNNNDDIDGFIVQLPLPKHISEEKITLSISPSKDVDGFHPVNIGKMALGMPCFLPATPQGIMELLKRYKIDTNGKNAVVIGRSNIVGRPLSILLSLNNNEGNSTVTVCHSRTKNLKEICLRADIIVTALGKPGFLKADMVKEGVVVIDVGTTRVEAPETKSGWRLKGDVDFENVAPKCSFITPVPGGVGPMTIVSLLQNTLKAGRF
ncbi:MAG: bifunctional 5,10-methylene-tetrahydrofolate dehydrogenase/5,10-methylene-tetrahydrofolate cyclohydrolase [Marinilabiliaceae bacterium]|nr:bifunctional 5,10-methylene-tetrahydrofolate dehydrogenase/5,10-methylene-tetrahydrofolate cyclohydrolase [Marinilabiliaceae bacterium]